jgi:hypothetical protein
MSTHRRRLAWTLYGLDDPGQTQKRGAAQKLLEITIGFHEGGNEA